MDSLKYECHGANYEWVGSDTGDSKDNATKRERSIIFAMTVNAS